MGIFDFFKNDKNLEKREEKVTKIEEKCEKCNNTNDISKKKSKEIIDRYRIKPQDKIKKEEIKKIDKYNDNLSIEERRKRDKKRATEIINKYRNTTKEKKHIKNQKLNTITNSNKKLTEIKKLVEENGLDFNEMKEKYKISNNIENIEALKSNIVREREIKRSMEIIQEYYSKKDSIKEEKKETTQLDKDILKDIKRICKENRLDFNKMTIKYKIPTNIDDLDNKEILENIEALKSNIVRERELRKAMEIINKIN